MKDPASTHALLRGTGEASGARFTAREIAQQPALWPEIARLVRGDGRLSAFLEPLLANPALRVILTGAGTSAYIGDCLAPALIGLGRVEAIATTDIVSNPALWLRADVPTLLVSFARSGNSPESVRALELADRLVPRCAHLIITCNRDGELYRRAETLHDAHAMLLPDRANDQSFAMTSSFTGMLLTAAMAFGLVAPQEARVAPLARLARRVMEQAMPELERLTHGDFERVVYLGSNELKGLARESALKMLELTDGRIVSIADSPLGFRHGPKTIVNAQTLIVMYLSADAYTRGYELDLLQELRRDGIARRVIALTPCGGQPGADADTLVLSDADVSPPLTSLELGLPYVVFAQTLALMRSLSLGLSPDRPNASGTVNRVVQGVIIHPYGTER